MITCDLCGKARDCLQKEIEGKEYDICSKDRGTVFLPPPSAFKEREDENPEPLPGEPPKIWGAVDRPH